MATGLMTYEKYSVKYDRGGSQMKKSDGSPVLDELLTTVRLDESTVKTLNSNWEGFNEYYVLAGKNEEPIKIEPIAPIVIAHIDIPLPFNAVTASKGITIEKLKTFNESEVDSILATMTKKELFALNGVTEPTKKEMQLTKNADISADIKSKLKV